MHQPSQPEPSSLLLNSQNKVRFSSRCKNNFFEKMVDVEMKAAPETRKRTASSNHGGGGHKKQKLTAVRKIGVPVNRLELKIFSFDFVNKRRSAF